MIPDAPTQAEVAAAFRAGARVLAGGPIAVRTGRATHVRDLMAARRGDPDPWHTMEHDGLVTDLAASGYRTLWVDGRQVNGGDVLLVDAARAAAPRDEDRHSMAGEEARMEAGKIALRIRDAHVRASLLTHLDGWAAIGAVSALVDSSEEGKLYEPPPKTTARVLVVVCPSTGRTYAHLVPAECDTARKARFWMMGLPDNLPADAET